MIGGIVRPRPEVWPYRPSRWALGLATLFPRLADRACRAMRVQEWGAKGISHSAPWDSFPLPVPRGRPGRPLLGTPTSSSASFN